jgi:hypothetical protein
MRPAPLLLLLLCLAAPLPAHAQAPATQPATRPTMMGLTPAKALEMLEIPADKKAQVLKIIETRDKASREWFQQNSTQIKLYREDYFKAKAAGDSEEVKSIAKLSDDLEKERTALYTDAKKQITDLLTPAVATAYFTLISVPPPPADRSRIRTVTVTFEKPDFTPQITSAVRDALLEMTQEPTQLDLYFSLQQAAMDKGIKKILPLFPDGQQFTLLSPIPEHTADLNHEMITRRTTSLELTRDQVAAIVKAVAEMKPQITPDAAQPAQAAAVEKALRQALTTLTDKQKYFLYTQTVRGTPGSPGNPGTSTSMAPPANSVGPALDALNLTPEKKAQALKLIEDHKAKIQLWHEKFEPERIALRQSYLKARKNNDQATMDASQKRATQIVQEYDAFVAPLTKAVKDLLGEADYQRLLTILNSPATQPADTQPASN